MTSISTSLSSYYQLFGQQGGGSATTSATLTQSLATALNALSTSGSGSGSDAYSLNLSPAAQQLISGTSSAGGTGTSGTSFTLTSAQQADIKTILEKYKDAPYTQATFDSIQSDLSAAGLGAPQLSAEDQVNSFNPTDQFLSALSGNYSSLITPSASASTEETKSGNYMQGIISAWQSISTTYQASAQQDA